MAYKLSKAADLDLKNVLSHTFRVFGKKQAADYARGLKDAFALIAEYPLANRERTEVQPPHRVHVFRAHLIFYLAELKRIFVTRILHGREDWQSGLDT